MFVVCGDAFACREDDEDGYSGMDRRRDVLISSTSSRRYGGSSGTLIWKRDIKVMRIGTPRWWANQIYLP